MSTPRSTTASWSVGGASPCRHVTALLSERIRGIDRTVTGLQQLCRTLTDTRATAGNRIADTGGVCGIIEYTTADRSQGGAP